ncbi:MAG TPA: PH domain-containing protein [Anaerolineaceae bacterium]|nr:PH domain-containing protein [Anaerolineaceae bacterium]
MSGSEEQLLPGEQVQLRARIQRVMFIVPVMLVLAGLALLILSMTKPASFPAFVAPAAVGVFLLGSFLFLYASFIFTTTKFEVTNRRILARAGWPRSNSLEIGLQRVDSILLRQSLPGRIFDYGTLIVVGSGGLLKEVHNIVAAREFRTRIEEKLPRHS